MIPSQRLIYLLVSILFIFSGCGGDVPDDVIAFTNVTVWTGTDQSSIDNAALLVQNGLVYDVISMTELNIPEDAEEIDMSGLFIIPGLINAHGHVGIADGLETGPSAHSEQNVINQLQLYARYGITTVVSLGDGPSEAFAVRNQYDPGANGMARLFMAGPVLSPGSPGEAAQDVAALMQHNPDWTKIRVDDNLGRSQKMSPGVYRAIIEESHEYGVPLAAHIVAQEDAKGLLEAGADLIAHSIRDEPVDSELTDLMLDRDICITPTLTRELSAFIYSERPDFFDDSFFLQYADTDVVNQLQQPEIQERYTGMAADYYRQALPLAKENMMALHNAGVRVALGTDSGPPARFQGYFEHMEMEMMQESGMIPGEILLSATRYASECMQIDDRVGTLEPGKHADFIVLMNNPFSDIRNAREIEAVYIGGNRVDR
jgi:imidazolonepropionase-like amidohydrolase